MTGSLCDYIKCMSFKTGNFVIPKPGSQEVSYQSYLIFEHRSSKWCFRSYSKITSYFFCHLVRRKLTWHWLHFKPMFVFLHYHFINYILFLYLLYYSMVVILGIYKLVYINSYIQVVTETRSVIQQTKEFLRQYNRVISQEWNYYLECSPLALISNRGSLSWLCNYLWGSFRSFFCSSATCSKRALQGRVYAIDRE